MKTVQLEMLAPTQDAAGLHLMRVYDQISIWKGMVLSPLDWGWIGSPLEPAKSFLPLSPGSILALNLCACKKESVRGWGCRKVRSIIKCSSICLNCKGEFLLLKFKLFSILFNHLFSHACRPVMLQ